MGKTMEKSIDNKGAYGIVYLVHDRANGKTYVGQTMRSLEKRKKEHLKDNINNPYFHNALRKRPEDFEWTILENYDNQREMDIGEMELGIKYKALSPHGYSLRLGEGRGMCSDETIDKMKKAQKKARENPEALYNQPGYSERLSIICKEVNNRPEIIAARKLQSENRYSGDLELRLYPCSKCGLEKGYNDFHQARYKTSKRPVRVRCKECRKEENKLFYFKRLLDRYKKLCLECQYAKPLRGQNICKKCLIKQGLSQCNKCKEILVIELNFYKYREKPRSICIDCSKVLAASGDY